MYDILQLNDMIVPELLDIAEQLKIPNTKKMDKQELVYKILDNQAIAGSKVSGDGKSKQRKRIIKTTTGNTTEEAIVESDKKPAKKLQVKKAHKDPIEEKSNIKKGRKKEELVDSEGGVGRLSVMYHPEPLKTIAGRESSLRVVPPHSGHTLIGSSVKLCLRSNLCSQA